MPLSPTSCPRPLYLGPLAHSSELKRPSTPAAIYLILAPPDRSPASSCCCRFSFIGIWLSHPLSGSDQDASSLRRRSACMLWNAALRHVGLESHSASPYGDCGAGWNVLTALNLLPLGQLDGGHVVYSLFGERKHKIISTCMVGLLVIMGKFYFPWWIWAVLMFFLGRRHPLVYDNALSIRPAAGSPSLRF